jgi:antitoxin (DNA-binding transcriptional repressor) of toxin-antitoxin stability system
VRVAQNHATRIALTEFKRRCLAVIDDVAQGETGPVVLLKRNRAVAAIVPIDDEPPEQCRMLTAVTWELLTQDGSVPVTWRQSYSLAGASDVPKVLASATHVD